MAEDPRPGDGPDSGAAPGAGDPGRAAGPPPSLEESLRAVSEAGSASLGATVDSLRALRGLISADLAMARSAAGRGLAWAGAAVVFGATAWLLATAWIVSLLERVNGLSWLSALAIATVFNLAITALAATAGCTPAPIRVGMSTAPTAAAQPAALGSAIFTA